MPPACLLPPPPLIHALHRPAGLPFPLRLLLCNHEIWTTTKLFLLAQLQHRYDCAQVYDARFKSIFDRLYLTTYKPAMDAAGTVYLHRLIDDMVALAVKMPGGYVWAAKNYDGDVQVAFKSHRLSSSTPLHTPTDSQFLSAPRACSSACLCPSLWAAPPCLLSPLTHSPRAWPPCSPK